MTILGINVSHNGSICILKNGNVKLFIEEDRISRKKFDDIPLEIFKKISINHNVDNIIITGLKQHWTKKFLELLIFYLKNLFPTSTIDYDFTNHHEYHALNSFYNSGFEKCLGLVIDSNGSHVFTEKNSNDLITETESIFLLEYPNNILTIFKSFSTINQSIETHNINKEIKRKIGLSEVYTNITYFLNFKWGEEGKVMGLSSYGKYNSQIPNLYTKNYSNNKVFDITSLNTGKLNQHYQNLFNDFKVPSQDLAFHVQQESQEKVGDYIEKYTKQTGLTKVCCAGGYFLNCVANYYLIKRFPNIKFYFEPTASDVGNSIGIAKWFWYNEVKCNEITPLNSLYLGPKYSKKQLLRKIKKYVDN